MIEIYVKVHPTVFSYYRNLYGTEKICLKNDPLMARRVKTILELEPAEYQGTSFKHFKILVFQLHNFRIANKRIKITSRNSLDDRTQYFLSRELRDSFDTVFLSSVASYCSAKDFAAGCQKHAIEDFMQRCNVDIDEINYQTLKKKWDRSEIKKKVFKKVKKRHKSVTVLSPAILS